MRVTINEDNPYGLPNLAGKVVFATTQLINCVSVRSSELLRVGVPKDAIDDDDMSESWLFLPNEFEYVEPKLQNCSDSNVGEGWEGFYDQAPIKKSKFRNH